MSVSRTESAEYRSPSAFSTSRSEPANMGGGHRRVPHPCDLLLVVAVDERKEPSNEVAEPVGRQCIGEDANSRGLCAGRQHAREDGVQVDVLFVEMHVEVELAGDGGPCDVDRVAGCNGGGQAVDGYVKTAMVQLVCGHDIRRSRGERRKDADVFAVCVPREHFAEELVSTDDGVEVVVPVRGAPGGAVDVGEVAAERLVSDEDEIERVRYPCDGSGAHESTPPVRC